MMKRFNISKVKTAAEEVPIRPPSANSDSPRLHNTSKRYASAAKNMHIKPTSLLDSSLAYHRQSRSLDTPPSYFAPKLSRALVPMPEPELAMLVSSGISHLKLEKDTSNKDEYKSYEEDSAITPAITSPYDSNLEEEFACNVAASNLSIEPIVVKKLSSMELEKEARDSARRKMYFDGGLFLDPNNVTPRTMLYLSKRGIGMEQHPETGSPLIVNTFVGKTPDRFKVRSDDLDERSVKDFLRQKNEENEARCWTGSCRLKG